MSSVILYSASFRSPYGLTYSATIRADKGNPGLTATLTAEGQPCQWSTARTGREGLTYLRGKVLTYAQSQGWELASESYPRPIGQSTVGLPIS